MGYPLTLTDVGIDPHWKPVSCLRCRRDEAHPGGIDRYHRRCLDQLRHDREERATRVDRLLDQIDQALTQ